MFENKKIEFDQEWKNEKIKFDPDSSPEAWKHYLEYYTKEHWNLISSFNIKNLFFYNYFASVGLSSGLKEKDKWLNYTNSKKSDCKEYNRLFALDEKTTFIEKNKITYCGAASRLGGETDFNFNESNFPKFETLFKGEDVAYMKKLEYCEESHHSLLNFSLMQSLGNLQGFKKDCCDERVDKFISSIDKFYSTEDKKMTAIIKYACEKTKNYEGLLCYLSKFNGTYDYCKKIYFISESLVDKLKKNGEISICNCETANNYIDLAKEFWDEKEFYFLKKEFLVIGSYFKNGGETYTREELLNKIMNDLGSIDEYQNNMLIKKCLERGFITDCGNDCYTR